MDGKPIARVVDATFLMADRPAVGEVRSWAGMPAARAAAEIAQEFDLGAEIIGTLGPEGMDGDFLRIIPFIGQSLIWWEPRPPRPSKGWRRHIRKQKSKGAR